jgi:isoquinoline 1-oxidoreductase alpha subunit
MSGSRLAPVRDFGYILWRLLTSGFTKGIARMAKLKINGELVDIEMDDTTPLLWVLREQLGLTGTKYSCGIGLCGSCTVLVDGEAVRSCVIPVSSFTQSEEIVTIEGLSSDGGHPLQKAWAELDVPQCGYCQPGMIMSAAALLNSNPDPTDDDINAGMTNICRCGTYNRVREGIHLAAKLKKGGRS